MSDTRIYCSYEHGRTLNGVLYFHRISDYRMGGIARKHFRLFRKLCGDETLKNVLIVTNMWGDVLPEVGEKREQELASGELFFQPALEQRSRMVRHDQTADSARRILRKMLGFSPVPLAIQREMVQEGKALSDTAAGLDLKHALDRQAAEHRAEMDGLRKEIEELIELKDTKHQGEVTELGNTVKDLQSQLQKLEDEGRSLQDVHQLYGERMEAMLQVMHEKEQELREVQGHAWEQKAKLAELEIKLQYAKCEATANSTTYREKQAAPGSSRQPPQTASQAKRASVNRQNPAQGDARPAPPNDGAKTVLTA